MVDRGLNTLVVIGLGLIGGSLAKAIKQNGFAARVVGISRRASTLELALENGVIDQAAGDISEIASELGEGDLVMIAVPTLTVPSIIADLKAVLPATVTITDGASVKGSVVAAIEQAYGEIPPQWVPGHPIAGSEKSGIEAVNAELYQRHRVIVTPLAQTGTEHLARVVALWQSVGAEVSTMTVEDHDEVLAATSHLPHLLAFGLVDTLAQMRDNHEIFRYAAGGFRDFTRIAASDPTMWRDISIANGHAIISVLDRLAIELGKMRAAVESGDGDYLMQVMTRARDSREFFGNLLENKAYFDNMNPKPLTFVATPGTAVTGTIRVPGDKSISHRSIMLGSIAEGLTEVTGFLEGEDALATLQAFRAMGVQIEGPNNGRVAIHGVGLNGLKAPANALYLGNSGTSMRLLSGLLAGQQFDVVMTGDESLSKRPMKRVSVPLSQMGAKIQTEESGTPPVRVSGGAKLRGMHYDMPIASAQVKSSLLLAGLYAEGETSVTEPAPTRDHTERMLRGFGYEVKTVGNCIALCGGGKLTATRIDVPADISSAAFFLVAASIAPGSDLTLQHVGINPTRDGVITILRLMGADIALSNQREVGGEPVADIRVRYAPLKGIRIPEDQVALAIDEFPVLFVAAACAEGETVLTGAEELRVKESDRIQAMADGLAVLGITAEPTPDGIVIQGGQLGSGTVESHDDHRIAMAFTIASLRASGQITINHCNNVATSFPKFVELAQSVGIAVQEHIA